jgi:hypothetical protein
MFRYFILAVAILVGLVLLARWFTTAQPARIAKVLKWTAAVVLAALAVFLALSGRLVLALWVLALCLPIFLRWRAVMRRIRSAAGPSTGQASTVETRMLRMTLDHDTGAMAGEVLEGRFRGRRLDEMSLEDHLELFGECARDDAQSAALLEAYLDRVHGAEWREAAGAHARAGAEAGGAGAGFRPGSMTRQEACEILGLGEGASEGEIKAAHHRLMLKLHPDRGGSTYLAAKINQAKEVLLKG